VSPGMASVRTAGSRCGVSGMANGAFLGYVNENMMATSGGGGRAARRRDGPA
jgi:hypothetical protein